MENKKPFKTYGVIERMGVRLEDGIVIPVGGWRRDYMQLVAEIRKGCGRPLALFSV